jgi:uncharacterized membrane protein YphA (DoxX/SURF4 family)
MNALIGIAQVLVAFIFFYSGVHKAYFKEAILVERGQTGVAGLSQGLITFIGLSEILGAVGLILPLALQKYGIIVPLAAFCLGCIMIPAAVIHFRRNELSNVLINLAVLVMCGLIGYYRLG